MSRVFDEARSTGLEPATSGSTVRCSNQLSYDPSCAEDYSPTNLSRKRCLDCQVSFFDQPSVACNVFS
jgi:hypothetical protein